MRRLLPISILLLAACAGGDADRAPPRSVLPGDAALPDGPALSVGHGRRRMVATLLQQNGEHRLWRSEDGRLALATDGARVVAVSGLAVVLAGTRLDGPDPLDDPAALLDRPAHATRAVDLMRPGLEVEGMRFGVRLDCRLRAARDGEALFVEERCGGGAAFTNRYWAVPETGAIWRSEQWVGGGEPLVIETLTPPAS